MQEANQAREQAEEAKNEGMLQAPSSIKGVVERMTSAAEQLSAQVEQASRGADEQSSRAGEAVTSMEEMNATVLEVAQNASRAAKGSDQGSQLLLTSQKGELLNSPFFVPAPKNKAVPEKEKLTPFQGIDLNAAVY